MKQKRFNELNNKIKKARGRFAQIVIDTFKDDINLDNPMDLIALQQLASCDLEIAMTIIQMRHKKREARRKP